MRYFWLAVLGILLAALLLFSLGMPAGEDREARLAADTQTDVATDPQGPVLMGQGRRAESGLSESTPRSSDSDSPIAPPDGVLLRVVDAENGHPVHRARVWPWTDCVTDELGRVRLPRFEEPSGTEIRVECRGYVPAVRRLHAPGIKLVSLRRGVPVIGQVRDASSKSPIPGATVRVRDGHESAFWQLSWTTDLNGGFEVPGAIAGRMLEVLVEIAGRAPTQSHVVVREPMTHVEVLVTDGGVLEGRLLRPDHSPAADVEVFLVPPGGPVPPRDPGPDRYHSDPAWHTAGTAHVRTTSDGTFALEGIPTEKDFVAVGVLGELWEVRSGPFRFTHAGERRRLTLTAQEPASLSVHPGPDMAKSIILYAVSVRGSTMWAHQKSGPALSGPCLVSPLSPGAYHVTAHLQGSPDLHRDLSVGPGDRLEWLLAPESEGAVSGVVVDSEGMRQAEVMLLWRGEQSLEGSTESDGSFRLDGVGAEEGELTALKWGPEGGECRMQGVAPGTHGLRLVLRPPEEVIVDVEGLPPDTQVTAGILTESGRSVVRCRLDGEGRLTCPRPDADAAFLVLLAEGCAPVLIDLPPTALDGPARLGPVRFNDGIVMEGRVVDPAGNPIVEADVWIAAWWSRARTKTDEVGAFRIEGLPRRSLLLGIQPQGAAPELQWVEPGVGVTLRLSAVGLVKGTVVSQDGTPVAGMTVRLAPVLDVSLVDDPSSGTLSATTDALGHFRFAAAAGQWSASIDTQGQVLADPLDVRLSSAEPSTIRFVLRRR